jgi:hypothetical protein
MATRPPAQVTRGRISVTLGGEQQQRHDHRDGAVARAAPDVGTGELVSFVEHRASSLRTADPLTALK